MLAVVQVESRWNIPIVGYELTPHIVVCRRNMTQTGEDVPESAPIDGHFLRYKWSAMASFSLSLCFHLLSS